MEIQTDGRTLTHPPGHAGHINSGGDGVLAAEENQSIKKSKTYSFPVDLPRQMSPSSLTICLQTLQCLAFLKVFTRKVWE